MPCLTAARSLASSAKALCLYVLLQLGLLIQVAAHPSKEYHSMPSRVPIPSILCAMSIPCEAAGFNLIGNRAVKTTHLPDQVGSCTSDAMMVHQ